MTVPGNCSLIIFVFHVKSFELLEIIPRHKRVVFD